MVRSHCYRYNLVAEAEILIPVTTNKLIKYMHKQYTKGSRGISGLFTALQLKRHTLRGKGGPLYQEKHTKCTMA